MAGMTGMECIQVHETRFYYRRNSLDPVEYSLFALTHGTVSVPYPAAAIERTVAPHILRLFNALYSAVCNCESVALVMCTDGGQIVYKPSQHGRLAVTSIIVDAPVPTPTQEEIDVLHTSDLATSINTLLFDYICTANGHFNVGVSLLPCAGISIPLTLTDDSIARWLQYWTHCMDKSAKCAALILRNRAGTEATLCTLGGSERDSQTLVY